MDDSTPDLSKIKPPAKAPSKSPDSLTKAGMEKQLLETKIDRARLENQSYSQDMKQRGTFAKGALIFVTIWMVAVILVISAAAIFGEGITINGKTIKFVMSEKVQITLLCTTTANVIGLLVIVMRYLFPSSTCSVTTKKKKTSRRSN